MATINAYEKTKLILRPHNIFFTKFWLHDIFEKLSMFQ